LLSHDGARWLDLANKRWIGAMNLLSNRSRHYHVDAFDDMVRDLNALGVDHVLCTGDVTNLALRQEFAFARGKFDQLLLGPLGVTVIPGNHDAYVAEGVPLFAELFGSFVTSDPGWEWTRADVSQDSREPDDLHWPIVRVRGELALIGTSTSRATPWFTAYGRLGSGQLARLQRVLGDPRLADKIRVVAIHHPPAGKRAENRIRGLRDHAAFAEVIAQTGAHLIVHGHEHRDMTEALAGPTGPVPVRGIASGTYFHKPKHSERIARYRIYELAGGSVVSDHVRVWDRQRRAFVSNPRT
jgi:3',5'-cyclic AMP phosphodiesterase CpdA